MKTLLELLNRLHDHEVECVVIGGMAAVVHGSAMVTQDLDLCAPFTPDNLQRLLNALDGLAPRHRMSPRQPKLERDPIALTAFHNLYLITDGGQLDILDSVDGVGDYATAAERAVSIEVEGRRVRVLDIDALIAAKERLGRPKDLQAIAELKAVRSRRQD